MSMLLSFFVLSAFSSEAAAQDMWQPVAPPNPAWGPDRDDPAFKRAFGVDVYVCPPNYPIPETFTSGFAGTTQVGCSNGRSTRYFESLEVSQEVTKDNGERIDVRFEGWLELVVYAYQPGGHMMALPQTHPGQEETLQVIVSNGRVTVGYYDPDSGTVVAAQGRAPGNRITRRRFFYSGPVPR